MVILTYPIKTLINFGLDSNNFRKVNLFTIISDLNVTSCFSLHSLFKIISITIKHEKIHTKSIRTKVVKTQSNVVGSKKKISPQKGTGNSRVSSKYASSRRGGGIIFGPQLRFCNHKLNKNIRKLAFNYLLLSKKNNILIIKNIINSETLDTKFNIYNTQLKLNGLSIYNKILIIFFTEINYINSIINKDLFLFITKKYILKTQCFNLLINDYILFNI